MVRELSVQEQKYLAVIAVLSDGRSVSEVAQQWGVSRQSVQSGVPAGQTSRVG
jgi:transposase